MAHFLLRAWDFTDTEAINRRMAVREQHLAYAKQMKDNGTLLIGGAILDENDRMIGSSAIFAFPDRPALEASLALDPYMTGQVWDKLEIVPFKVPSLFI